MTKTNTEIITFINAGTAYAEKNDKGADSKFKYALRKVIKGCKVAYETYAASMEDLRIQHCSVDAKNQTILRDDRGGYVFTKEGLRAFNKSSKELLAENVDITPHIAQAIPDDLTDDEREVFAGFVLPDVAEDSQ